MDFDFSANEPLLRAGVFVLVFVAMAAWELRSPRRTQHMPRRARWPSNLGVVTLNTVLVRVLFPLTAVAWATSVTRDGALHGLPVPPWVAVVIAFVLLDLPAAPPVACGTSVVAIASHAPC